MLFSLRMSPFSRNFSIPLFLLLATFFLLSSPTHHAFAEDAPAAAEEQAAAEEEEKGSSGIQGKINEGAGFINEKIDAVLFYGIPTGLKNPNAENPEDEEVTIPLIVLVLVLGGIIFTLLYGFINLRLFGHSIAVIRGKYDHPDDDGEITHFQALTSALSATVGLGNIAMVAVAIHAGGPGAVFWMWVIAFFGMCLKFSSCTFAQTFRKVKPDGTVLGGPMIYLSEGIKKHIPSLAPLGMVLAVVYAVFTILGSLGGGNMFQGNQSFSIVHTEFGWSQDYAWLFGILIAVLVGVVIIGGIKRIGEVTSKIVPAMCVFYCLCCLTILGSNMAKIPAVFNDIFASAWSLKAGMGALIAVLLIGAKRAVFSNEAGLGSAAIAHAAAKTKEPVREGIVAMIGPFLDTHIVCTMTALTILITGSHLLAAEPGKEIEGITITTAAFSTLGAWAPKLLCIAVFVFAYSTMISWCFYGERACEFLFGEKSIKPYRVVYVIFVALGPILSLQSVIDFSEMMLLSMAFPNIIGMLILYRYIRPAVKDYVARLRSGEIKPYK